MIFGQSRPLELPPVKTASVHVSPVSSSMIRRWPRATYAAASSTARTQAARLGAHGIVDVEAEERRRGVDPALGVHELAEDPPDAVRAGRDLRRGLVHDRVGVHAALRRLGLLQVAERVAEPAHGDAAVEADPLGHPLPGEDVAERPQAPLRVDEAAVGHDGRLPEAAADDRAPAGPGDPDAEEAELRVGAAHDDRRALGEAGLGGGLRRDLADDRAGLDHGREDRGIEADEPDELLRPAEARRSNRSELEPQDGSVTYSPESFVRTQSLSMLTWAARSATSGWCRRSTGSGPGW